MTHQFEYVIVTPQTYRHHLRQGQDITKKEFLVSMPLKLFLYQRLSQLNFPSRLENQLATMLFKNAWRCRALRCFCKTAFQR